VTPPRLPDNVECKFLLKLGSKEFVSCIDSNLFPIIYWVRCLLLINLGRIDKLINSVLDTIKY
jgi:hypothetical protein